MSSVVRPTQQDIDAYGYLGLRMGADDFLGLGQTRERYELVHGVVCMSPRPNTLHQTLLLLIAEQLRAYCRSQAGARVFPDVDVVVAGDTVYAPDLVCYLPGRVKGYPVRLDTAPDLVVEILSHGTKAFDLTTKLDDYQKFGVPEYWTYDPSDGQLRCFRRNGAELVRVPVSGERVESTALPGFVLDLRPLREAASI
ncbi:MAG: Uma2 family endonuclease [Phycisphaerales bacterium]